MKRIYWQCAILWFFLAIIAIVNGTIREFGYKPLVGDYIAHLISTILYIGMMLAVMAIYFRRIVVTKNKHELLKIGFSLLIATIIFEFIFGHYVIGHPWEKLFADYNIFQGRVWGIVLLAILFGPRLVGKTKESSV